MTNFNIERKNYSRFTAQIAKNVARKKIVEIRSRGATAADELIDELVSKNQKNSQKRSFGDEIAPLIEKNRSKWRNFIIEVSGRFDPEALASVGVNFIYGGLLTSSVGNTAWASVITVDGENKSRLREILEKGRNRGNFVWILRGKEVFSPETIKIIKYFPESAFILVADREVRENELYTLKNILLLIKKGERMARASNIPYILVGENDPIFNCGKKGSDKKLSGISSDRIVNFIENPSFPISIDSFSDSLDLVEYLLSGGREERIPYYFT